MKKPNKTKLSIDYQEHIQLDTVITGRNRALAGWTIIGNQSIHLVLYHP